MIASRYASHSESGLVQSLLDTKGLYRESQLAFWGKEEAVDTLLEHGNKRKQARLVTARTPVNYSRAGAMTGSDEIQPADLKSPATVIVDVLRNEIVSGVLAPNAPLGQDGLASRFGVSRMPVREAIWQLEALGFVTIEPNRRARVASASRADFVEIFDMRLVAECLAIRRAMPELSNARIDRAEAIQKQLEGASGERFGALNGAFHMMLYRAAPQPRLLAHLAMLGNAADRYRSMTRAAPSFREKSDREHYELLAACRNRDADAAVDCLTRHIGDARDALAPLVE